MTTLAYTVPQAGTDLNSVADPEIASALNTIKTWANGNIDTTNLSAAALAALSQLAFRNATSNISANPGDLIVATGGITVTLPTPAGANVRVGIVAASSVTGASPVTVSFPGQTIYGPGYSGASFLLGMGASFALLQSISSTQYVTVAGQQDTGWVALTPATSITSGGYGASSRLGGDKVRLKGTLTNGTGATDTGTLATITAAHRPSATLSLSAAASGAAPTVNVQITAAGALADPNGLVAGAILSLDGLTYTLS